MIFYKVEEKLVSKEVKFRTKVGPLREEFKLYRFKGIEVEDELKIRDFNLTFTLMFVFQRC